ncbi:MAG: cation transporter [Synechococcales cyanobacterium C42_A2020_086]|jgi:copper chaperone CopZ|nr:cation transporter [Synechococcales cyanobacterium C42_A2020_086]
MDYQIVHAIPERLRIRIPLLATSPEYANKLQHRVESLQGVTSVRINLAAVSMIVTYKAKKTSQDTLLAALHTAIEELAPPPDSPETASIDNRSVDNAPIDNAPTDIQLDNQPAAPSLAEPTPPPAEPASLCLDPPADPWDDAPPLSPEMESELLPQMPLEAEAELPTEVLPAQEAEPFVPLTEPATHRDPSVSSQADAMLAEESSVSEPLDSLAADSSMDDAADASLTEQKPRSRKTKSGKTAAAQRRSPRSTSSKPSRKQK